MHKISKNKHLWEILNTKLLFDCNWLLLKENYFLNKKDWIVEWWQCLLASKSSNDVLPDPLYHVIINEKIMGCTEIMQNII